MNIFADAIRKVGEDRSKIREAILAIRGYEGAFWTQRSCH